MAITQSGKDRAKGKFPLGCFFTLFMLFGLGMSIVFLWPIVNIVEARSWRQVPCTILSSKVERHSGSKGSSTYSVAVTYEYAIDDQRHVGTRYKFMSGSSSGRKGKAGIVRRFPAGSQAACYVNLRNPADARTAGL